MTAAAAGPGKLRGYLTVVFDFANLERTTWTGRRTSLGPSPGNREGGCSGLWAI